MDRPPRPDPLACYDCGLLYGGPGWLDTTIPADDWNAISPTGGYGGILCITCMARKLQEVGRDDVPLIVGSGPFRHDPSYWWLAGFEAGRRSIEEDLMDLERLNEALEQFDNEHALDRAAADALWLAARAYRDLLANGERVDADMRAAAKAHFHYTDPDKRDWDTLPAVFQEDRIREIAVAVHAAIGDRLLVSGGERVEWCEVHRRIAWEDFGEDNAGFYMSRGHRCPSGEWIEGAAAWDCSVVSRLLVDPPTEEARDDENLRFHSDARRTEEEGT